MRRFRFRLESVLRHRETLEGMCEQEFGAAQSRLQAEQARMDQLRAEFDRCVAERPGGAQGERFDAHMVYDRERYLETLQAALEQQSRRVEAASITAEEKRQALVAARQAREAVSRLRQQEFAAYTAQALKHEQDVLDEQATVRFVRNAEAAAAQTHAGVPAADAPEADDSMSANRTADNREIQVTRATGLSKEDPTTTSGQSTVRLRRAA
jgi:flagellar FliJ protein